MSDPIIDAYRTIGESFELFSNIEPIESPPKDVIQKDVIQKEYTDDDFLKDNNIFDEYKSEAMAIEKDKIASKKYSKDPKYRFLNNAFYDTTDKSGVDLPVYEMNENLKKYQSDLEESKKNGYGFKNTQLMKWADNIEKEKSNALNQLNALNKKASNQTERDKINEMTGMLQDYITNLDYSLKRADKILGTKRIDGRDEDIGLREYDKRIKKYYAETGIAWKDIEETSIWNPIGHIINGAKYGWHKTKEGFSYLGDKALNYDNFRVTPGDLKNKSNRKMFDINEVSDNHFKQANLFDKQTIYKTTDFAGNLLTGYGATITATGVGAEIGVPVALLGASLKAGSFALNFSDVNQLQNAAARLQDNTYQNYDKGGKQKGYDIQYLKEAYNYARFQEKNNPGAVAGFMSTLGNSAVFMS